MRAIAGYKWGASTTTLKHIYIALIRSILDYGGAAIECASKYAIARLDVIQSNALIICCGAQRGTPRAALQVEMGEQHYIFDADNY